MKATHIITGVFVVAVVAGGVYFGLMRSGGGPSPSPAMAKERADKVFASLKARGGEVTYKAAAPAGKGIVIKDVELKQKIEGDKPFSMSIGEIRINEYDWDKPDLPTYGDVEYRQIRFAAVTQSEQWKEFSTVTGLKDFVVNAKTNYKYDATSKTIDVKTGELEFEGMGTLSITLKVDGLDLAALQSMQGTPDPTKMLAMLGSVRMHGLRVAFKDAGGTAKLIKFAAHKEKKSEDDIKKQALDQVAQQKSAPFRIAREAASAAEAFVRKPGLIAVEAKPKAPFATAQFMALAGKFEPAAIDKLTDELGLTIKAD
jgi:hypothetical protein